MREIIMWRGCAVVDKNILKTKKQSFIQILLVASYENLFETQFPYVRNR